LNSFSGHWQRRNHILTGIDDLPQLFCIIEQLLSLWLGGMGSSYFSRKHYANVRIGWYASCIFVPKPPGPVKIQVTSSIAEQPSALVIYAIANVVFGALGYWISLGMSLFGNAICNSFSTVGWRFSLTTTAWLLQQCSRSRCLYLFYWFVCRLQLCFAILRLASKSVMALFQDLKHVFLFISSSTSFFPLWLTGHWRGLNETGTRHVRLCSVRKWWSIRDPPPASDIRLFLARPHFCFLLMSTSFVGRRGQFDWWRYEVIRILLISPNTQRHPLRYNVWYT